jgi:hypothetical protein
LHSSKQDLILWNALPDVSIKFDPGPGYNLQEIVLQERLDEGGFPASIQPFLHLEHDSHLPNDCKVTRGVRAAESGSGERASMP